MAAQIGIWTGGSQTGFPVGSTFTALPSNSFGTTQDRNDGSVYTFNTTNNRLTLPSTGLASAYLVVARIQIRISHNNRCACALRFIKTTAGGAFYRTIGSGYARNSSNDEIYITCAAVVLNPPPNTEFELQWSRDAGDGTPTGSIIKSQLQVTELKNIQSGSIYSGTANDLLGGTSPNVVTLSTTNTQSGTNITRSGNVITLSGLNRKYLLISSQFYVGRGGRTQRWFGYRVDGTTYQTDAQHCVYYRNASNDRMGGYIFDIIDVGGSSKTIELTAYRGDGVTNDSGGADIDGSIPVGAEISICILELPSYVEVFRSSDSTGLQNLSVTSDVNINGARSFDFNDSSSFTKASDSSINIEKNMDIFTWANIGSASFNVTSGTRHLRESQLTINGTKDSNIFHGNYGRGNQGTQDTFGNSFHPVGIKNVNSGDDLGFDIIDTGDDGTFRTQPDWVSFAGINLNSLDTPVVTQRRIFIS